MKRIFVIAACAVALAGCTKPSQARDVLEAQGYSDIEITGYDMWGCSEDDDFHTGFRATGQDGNRVRGTVCSGWFKGATVRVHRRVDR